MHCRRRNSDATQSLVQRSIAYSLESSGVNELDALSQHRDNEKSGRNRNPIDL